MSEVEPKGRPIVRDVDISGLRGKECCSTSELDNMQCEATGGHYLLQDTGSGCEKIDGAQKQLANPQKHYGMETPFSRRRPVGSAKGVGHDVGDAGDVSCLNLDVE